MKKIFSIFAAVLFAGSMMAGTVKLTNANIVAAGDAANGYNDWAISDGTNTWNAHAIKNKHSNATADKHFLQIKKYDSSKSEAFYIQIPNVGENIQSITMTVSSTSKAMDGGGNTATLFFGASNTTSAAGAGVVSGTGAASVTIDASDLGLQTGYITASAAVRVWDITVTTAAAPDVAKPVIAGEEVFYKKTHVTITCATEGASIYYTTNGLDPDLAEDYTESYPSSGLDIEATTTVKAVAIKGTGLDTKYSAVASKTFTKATVMTVADAIAALVDNTTVIENAYVKGIISKVGDFNDKYGSITYWISADGGTESAQLKIYGGLGMNGDEFVTVNALKVGDKVTVTGTLMTYGSEKEMDKNNFLVEFEDVATAISNTAVDAKAVKTFENGQLIIIKNGVKYNALGAMIQ